MSLVHNGRRALRGLLPLQRAFSATPAAAQQPAQAQAPSDSIEVFVNEQPVSIPKGSTVLQACDAAGIDIPRCGAHPGCTPRPPQPARARAARPTRRRPPQVLLPPEALHRRQLPHVPGGGAPGGRPSTRPPRRRGPAGGAPLIPEPPPSAGGEEPQAGGLLRHARGSRHEDQDRHAHGQEGARGRHGVPAGEASGRGQPPGARARPLTPRAAPQINHPLDCPICDQGGECDLQDQVRRPGPARGRRGNGAGAAGAPRAGPSSCARAQLLGVGRACVRRRRRRRPAPTRRGLLCAAPRRPWCLAATAAASRR
jgi:hypothetical protein